MIGDILQPTHLIIILVIILVVFGPGKLPQLGKAVGDSMRDFKKAIDHSPDESTAVLAPGMRACPNCKKPVAIEDRFCGGCGARSDVTTAA